MIDEADRRRAADGERKAECSTLLRVNRSGRAGCREKNRQQRTCKHSRVHGEKEYVELSSFGISCAEHRGEFRILLDHRPASEHPERVERLFHPTHRRNPLFTVELQEIALLELPDPM